MEDCKEINKIEYSIIIPHKNSPALLQRCLDSIPNREDVQVIVVDDNSDSEKVDFTKFPGLNRPHTEVYFTKEGKGAGYARNVGLKYAKGKWLLFVDADDFLADDFLRKVDAYADSDNDVIYFRLADESDFASIPEKWHDIIDLERGNNYNILLKREIGFVKLYHNIPVGKMIRFDCVQKNNITFDEVPCANDIMFFTKFAFCVKNAAVSSECIYCVSKPTGRNLTSRKDYYSGKIRLQVLLNRNDYLIKHGRSDMLMSPIWTLWQFRTVGIKNLFLYCKQITNSSTPLFTGISKLFTFSYYKRLILRICMKKNYL